MFLVSFLTFTAWNKRFDDIGFFTYRPKSNLYLSCFIDLCSVTSCRSVCEGYVLCQSTMSPALSNEHSSIMSDSAWSCAKWLYQLPLSSRFDFYSLGLVIAFAVDILHPILQVAIIFYVLQKKYLPAKEHGGVLYWALGLLDHFWRLVSIMHLSQWRFLAAFIGMKMWILGADLLLMLLTVPATTLQYRYVVRSVIPEVSGRAQKTILTLQIYIGKTVKRWLCVAQKALLM